MKPFKIHLLFLLIIISISSLKAQKNEEKDQLVEMEVKTTKPYYGSSYLIELTKKGASENWFLPMIIGECEARAAVRSKNETPFPRPLTYDLFASIFSKTNLKLKHVVITKLFESTFYAVLVIEDNGKTIEIDSRPSDAINIALKTKVSIFATETVINDAKETRE